MICFGQGGLRSLSASSFICIPYFITFLQVDAIVNTTSKDLNLNNGAVSKAILQAAGTSIQVGYLTESFLISLCSLDSSRHWYLNLNL